MSLLHAVISKGATILCEHGTDASASYSASCQTILTRIPPNSSKLTYSADQHLFHYIRDNNNLTVLCVADDQLGRRVPFAFLAELLKSFLSEHTRDQVRFIMLLSVSPGI